MSCQSNSYYDSEELIHFALSGDSASVFHVKHQLCFELRSCIVMLFHVEHAVIAMTVSVPASEADLINRRPGPA